MNRRIFASSAATTLTALGAVNVVPNVSAQTTEPFKLNYAPGFRHFKNSAGPDPRSRQVAQGPRTPTVVGIAV